MKSVIINLKYLIFRSASASEGGSLEEQQREGEGKSGAAASVLSASATLKPAPTQARTVFLIFFGGVGGSLEGLLLSKSVSEVFVQDPVHIYSFISAPPDWALVSVGATLAPSLKLHPQPWASAPERLGALVIRCEACLTLTDKPALTMPVPAA